jgi:protoporphyrinogen oxidase
MCKTLWAQSKRLWAGRYICRSVTKKRIAIIGAGPAGLTAAFLLGRHGLFDVVVFEKHPKLVGGISRTESHKGYLFDIGGHRFFSKAKQVEDFWTEILGDELLERPRSSRIYYNQKFFAYPLVAADALRQLGLAESMRCVLSYFRARLKPIRHPANFEEWVSNEFGERLYRIFFKTYTEKVWGIPCTEISADWAAQRIKGLNLGKAILSALGGQKQSAVDAVIKTLIDSFRYPRLGPGQMWETCRQKAVRMGVDVRMGTAVEQLLFENNTWSIGTNQGTLEGGFNYVVSSAPLRELVGSIRNSLPQDVLDAANGLQYRDFITIVLMARDLNRFNDNWIYIHDASVKVGRIQNFKSWSPHMVPDPTMTCYGLEYFCMEGDGLWNMDNKDLAEMAISEIEKIGLCQRTDIQDSCVVRQAKAYPVYSNDYQARVETIRNGTEHLHGLMLVGRNGMHKYNNQDHSMMTAMLAVENILAGRQLYDLWKVNQDAEYIEKGERGGSSGRLVPSRLPS